MVKFAFSCSTKYQLMNIVTFVYSNVENSFKNSELYIFVNDKNRQDFDYIKEKLLNFCFFKNIYLINDIQYQSSAFKRKFKTLSLVFHEKKYLIKNIDPNIKNEDEIRCEILVVPCTTFIFEILIQTLKPREVYFIEDGFGSYVGNINKKTITVGHQIFNKIFKRELYPKCMYVRNLKFYKGTMDIPIKQLPNKNDTKLLDILSILFKSVEKVEYSKYKFIYLDQPFFEVSNKLNNEKFKLINKLNHTLEKDMIIRKHPRTLDMLVEGVPIDDSNSFWEYLCYNDINENHVLLSVTSTAMYSPFILFQKEPYLVFLFNLLSFNEYEKEKFNISAKHFKSLYQDRNRIFIPNTIVELEFILSNLKN